MCDTDLHERYDQVTLAGSSAGAVAASLMLLVSRPPKLAGVVGTSVYDNHELYDAY